MLENIRIVLVETSHNGNIGSVARAMKTMGIHDLYLVNPKANIDSHAVALAAGASDIIGHAKIVSSLEEAITGCGLVIATSARSRSLDWPILTAREAGEKVTIESQNSQVAMVFGRERSGLTNEELQQCHYHLAVDANPEYSSLNLAMAVQIVCYEIRTAWQLSSLNVQTNTNITAELATTASIEIEDEQLQSSLKKPKKEVDSYPPVEDLERFYDHLETVLQKSQFIRKSHPGQIMARLRRLYTRARPNAQELNILRGILASVEKFIPDQKE
ncbi:tRNA (cytosine(32)/uridine(32)-2'-O)-methyltransferase TrmJ [Thorsellia anophelis]|uniref:tRNA (cytidine/uridine-2'-O-)-methyltransferase TrmJ n=1 Tax=Thorsellia anophelis DSM 18579 TaxID=1123402 RepID=A0A1I0B3U4_9GAMM|nr:tRNA (cytosine(32)/uridine(32)-2'-O)-methyltransferase TrmJ [Thorsellia anophelis]SET01356.1 tRNA (cytidine32/uridine32-2'-O)-methyltransferase [Thorsellia anophelis DSM 18579]